VALILGVEVNIPETGMPVVRVDSDENKAYLLEVVGGRNGHRNRLARKRRSYEIISTHGIAL